MVNGGTDPLMALPPQLLNVSVIWMGIINSIYTSNAIYNVSTERFKTGRKANIMALNFTFPGIDGKPVEGELRRGKYADNGTLAVVVYSKSDLGNFMEPYQVLTVNLMSDVQDDETAFIDDNNCSFDLVSAITGFGKFIGHMQPSGYCTYQAFRFDKESLEKMTELD